jgi:hypothetical protein
MGFKTKAAILALATVIPGGYLVLGTIWIYRKVTKKPEVKVDIEKWKEEETK